MRPCLYSEHPSIWLGLFCTVLWVPLAYPTDNSYAQVVDPQVAEARICNVDGEVSIRSQTRGMDFAKVTLQDSVASGDRIETAKNSIVSMLIGEDAVVNIDQLSEVTIDQTEKYPKVVHVLRGTTSISTKSQHSQTNANVPVKTLTSMIYPTPGTMFRVTVMEQDAPPSRAHQHPQAILTTYTDQDSLFVQDSIGSATRKTIETIEVTHGSVEIVPRNTDISPITVEEQFQVDITNGKIGTPDQGSGTTFDIQNMQAVPQHSSNPEPLRSLIADTQSSQATGLVAALITPNTSTNAGISDPRESDLITAITNLELSRTPVTITSPQEPGVVFQNNTIEVTGPNSDVVEVAGQAPVEINTSSLTLNNSDVGASGTNDDIALVSVSSGGTLRGISVDPVINIEDSQATVRTAVEVIDDAALQASAPLIAMLSSTPSIPASLLATANGAVEISGGQLIASLPADALALIEINGSSLTSAGALFDVNGGGILAVNGNLVSLTNGGQLSAASLVALSGGSTFALVGGSLLVGDGSGLATINNSLCAGGGCQGGFVFAPAGNSVTIDPGFQATQSVNVSPDAALVVVNGTGNTVNLGP